MFTRSKGLEPEKISDDESKEDSNLGTTVDTTDLTNNSDLINLDQTLRPISSTTANLLNIMATEHLLDFKGAISLVPSFSGGTASDLHTFETKCNFVLESVSPALKPIILKAIIAQMSGKAAEAVRYREITTWDELKAHFRTIFGTAHSITYLQMQLSSMRQNENESVKQFSTRIEQTYHELTHALTANKTPNESAIIASTIQAHALSIFYRRY